MSCSFVFSAAPDWWLSSHHNSMFQAATSLQEEQTGEGAGGDGPPGLITAYSTQKVCWSRLLIFTAEVFFL